MRATSPTVLSPGPHRGDSETTEIQPEGLPWELSPEFVSSDRLGCVPTRE